MESSQVQLLQAVIRVAPDNCLLHTKRVPLSPQQHTVCSIIPLWKHCYRSVFPLVQPLKIFRVEFPPQISLLLSLVVNLRNQPTAQPTAQPTGQPTSSPSDQPTAQPSSQPTAQPSSQPTAQPTAQPSGQSITGSHVWVICPPRECCKVSPETEAAERAFISALHGRGESLAQAEASARVENSSFAHYDGGILHIVLLKDINMHEMWRQRAELGELMENFQERNFQFVDEATRRTGRIIKMHRMVSVKGFSFRQLHLRFVQWEGQRAADSHELYPQLLGHQFVLDLPSVLRSIYWNVVRPLLPESVVAKTHVLDTSLPADKTILEHHLCGQEQLPSLAGGSSSLPWPWPFAEEIPVLGDTQFKRYDEPSFNAII